MAIRTFNSVGGFSVGEVPTTVILANGDITTGNANLTANVSAGNVKTDHLLYANGTAWTFAQPAGGTNGQIQYYENGGFGASANLIYYSSNSLFAVTGNVQATNFIGNVVGNISGNLVVPGANTCVVINDDGSANSFGNFTFDKATSLMTVTGNANVTNTINAGNLNVTGRIYSNLLPSVDNSFSLGNSSLKWSNVFTTAVNVGGTSNITASGNVLQIDALYSDNNISAGTLTSRGTALLQGDATISGNLTVGGNTTYINVTNLSVNDPLIEMGGSNNGGNATSYDGKDRGLILHNYYSNGSGPINQAFIWKTSASEFEIFSNVIYSGEIIDTANSTYGNIKASTFLGNLSGTLLTANQYLITNVGTLGNLNVTNTITSANANITGSFKAVGLTYPTSDGTNGQVLTTNGSGILSFSTIDTYRISNGTSNVTVYSSGNVTTSVAGTSNVFVVTSTGANITGYANISGNAFINGNVTTGNVVLGVTSLSANTVTTATTSLSTIASVDTTNVTGVIFDVIGLQNNYPSANKYSIATVTALTDGTTVDYTVYGTVLLGGGSTGTLSCTYTSGTLYLKVTPASSASTTWTTQYRSL